MAETASPKVIRGRGTAGRGFSLVEVLFVVLVMGILMGVAGSLMWGFVSNFELTDDQAIARRRAQDVFNILQVPILNAGLGLPSDDPPPSAPLNNEHYFGTVNALSSPISGWNGPVQLISNDFGGRGDALRIVYSVYSGVKQVSDDDVVTFGGEPSGQKTDALEITSPLPGGYDGITAAGSGTSHSVHSYITFPGMGMRPILVTGGMGTDTIDVAGMTPRTPSSGDVVTMGVIRPYHDIYLVRAGVAYVDDDSTFCFADITDTDISAGALPKASELTGAAYRVEGIKAVRFNVELAGDAITSVTVSVVAEGDSNITGRQSNAGTASQGFRANYPGVVFDDEAYYEEFEMRWRTRNVEVPEA
ncbi:MAG: prepilin-type N-terminal cleavage/methylation domain-containing protein [Synergistaceae bacterium]|jgi:prepilin-type N-terminal cleavage/methylation domain-containing protein|nr:prepilin-type N-terminal cleavage/methylation domain-containing protein [Synergistaceae bacterium]